ncbi:P-II family nitrogen regulator [Candidatus Nitrosotalea okcheonensis]|uniref:Nitrogen regulatory protein P-II n=1 Tax=Candidatus Nitrosotalea okcheonensis TaxID=1903276 RepID=A0A2H1FD65_9ARCH|nr:P-II family nitrogen regulator [Candidatus Nitrosotalea okcheonensis]SMH70716.1 Nitrogen regulatory protein P-II [Candidatus Nitrosotalea okcheonensis]
MLKIEVVLPENEIKSISDALKKLSVGGITAYKGWGRGKTIAKEIHASKGTEVFTPEFGERFILEVIVPDEKKNNVIAAIRESSKFGKIFVTSISEAYDIQTPKKDEQVI